MPRQSSSGSPLRTRHSMTRTSGRRSTPTRMTGLVSDGSLSLCRALFPNIGCRFTENTNNSTLTQSWTPPLTLKHAHAGSGFDETFDYSRFFSKFDQQMQAHYEMSVFFYFVAPVPLSSYTYTIVTKISQLQFSPNWFFCNPNFMCAYSNHLLPSHDPSAAFAYGANMRADAKSSLLHSDWPTLPTRQARQGGAGSHGGGDGQAYYEPPKKPPKDHASAPDQLPAARSRSFWCGSQGIHGRYRLGLFVRGH